MTKFFTLAVLALVIWKIIMIVVPMIDLALGCKVCL